MHCILCGFLSEQVKILALIFLPFLCRELFDLMTACADIGGVCARPLARCVHRDEMVLPVGSATPLLSVSRGPNSPISRRGVCKKFS